MRALRERSRGMIPSSWHNYTSLYNNPASLLVNRLQGVVWLAGVYSQSCASAHSQSERALQTLSSQPASSHMWTVLHYVAMWFLLAAEIQSTLKVSHEKRKSCALGAATGPNLSDSALPLNTVSFHWLWDTPILSCLPRICKQWDV